MYPLADLFNLSFIYELPEIWKYSHITALHEGCDVLDFKNYRPISIICSISYKKKYKAISSYFCTYHILTTFQYSFRSN